jgi:chromobox protein 1
LNRETAPDILSEYLAKLGGKELLLSQWKEKKAQVEEKKSKKRARSSTGQETVVTKRGRKNDVEHGSGTPPASARRGEFKPPTGSWEDEVTGIDACEGSQGKVVVYLTWKGGDKSQHPLAQVYKRCPQKVNENAYHQRNVSC